MHVTCERGQSEMVTCSMVPTTCHSGKGKTMETEKRSRVARGWGPVEEMNKWSPEDS